MAHGGHCVARLAAEVPEVGGTVVFVRHALPGERVSVVITEGSVGDRFLRGDAVAILDAAADRVRPPCPYAGPGLCGGCDFQHVDLTAQRRLKGQVVAEQLRRLAGLEVHHVEVEAVRGDETGLGWRSRMRFHPRSDGRLGLRAHRSHQVVPIDRCLIQAPNAVTVVPAGGDEGGQAGGVVVETVLGREFTVAREGFWQPHVGAPEVLVSAVLDAAALVPGDTVVDLYSGVGLFSAFLAEAVGSSGRVVAVEGDPVAGEHAAGNLAAHPWAEVIVGPVDRVLSRSGPESADVVVLDPPREGARRRVVEQVAALRPRIVVHVACDPAAFARDTGILAEHGYALDGLRAFDLFPMTQHVEVVGTFRRTVS